MKVLSMQRADGRCGAQSGKDAADRRTGRTSGQACTKAQLNFWRATPSHWFEQLENPG